ncbi:MAG TPA: thioredoxin domain-containing protein [Gaiella sp.]|jgi:protein-disulfide isomerase|nr:thioredoxin domain-containing protein [Gaiella sp.]
MPPKPRKPPPRHPGTRNRNLLIAAAGAVAVVAVLVVVSVVVAGGGGDNGTSGTTPGDATSALFAGIPQTNTELGAQGAPVTMIQFEDLQCPICREYQMDGFSDIVQQYVRPGKVKLRFAGLAFIGQDSEKALLYVLAAGKQGKLWQFSDALYANQGDENSGWVTDDLLERIAGDLGLDWTRLKQDAASKEVAREAQASAGEGARLQVQGTPSFFIQIGNGQPYQVHPSSFSIDSFRPIFDDALAQ